MEDDAPAAKRTRLHRTCKASTSNALSPIESTSKTIADADDVTHQTEREDKPNSDELEMLDMNDHCLLELLERLHLCDLCIMAEVCVRLKKLAQRIFHSKYRNMCLTQLADPNTGKCTMAKIRQLLYNFGHLIKSLTIDYKVLKRRKPDKTSQEEVLVFAFVRKYCFATIDEVIIYYDHFNESDGAVPIIMKNIQKIVIFNFGSMMFLKNIPDEPDETGSGSGRSKMIFQRPYVKHRSHSRKHKQRQKQKATTQN